MNQEAYICPPLDPPIPHPIHPMLSKSMALSSRCHIANPHWLSIWHFAMFMFQFYSLNLSHPLLPPLCLQVHSLLNWDLSNSEMLSLLSPRKETSLLKPPACAAKEGGSNAVTLTFWSASLDRALILPEKFCRGRQCVCAQLCLTFCDPWTVAH